jgi:hypothetical protein
MRLAFIKGITERTRAVSCREILHRNQHQFLEKLVSTVLWAVVFFLQKKTIINREIISGTQFAAQKIDNR